MKTTGNLVKKTFHPTFATQCKKINIPNAINSFPVGKVCKVCMFKINTGLPEPEGLFLCPPDPCQAEKAEIIKTQTK
jgi:hypothetical protein